MGPVLGAVRPFRGRLLVGVAAYYVALITAHGLWPHLVGDVFFGAMLIVPPFGIVVVLVSDPRAAAWARGADSEGWTSIELRKAFGSAYVVIDDLQLGERGNADHVVVGPAGVWVIEVKWSGEPWTTSTGWDRVRVACRQVNRNAREIARRLADNGIATSVQPVVVLWGGGIRDWAADTGIRQVDSTTVVAGTAIRLWRRMIAGTTLDRTDCAVIVTTLRG